MHIYYKGVKLEYGIEGRGKPLLFLHGYGGSGESFKDAISFFSKSYRCIYPDFIGFGQSDYPNLAYELLDYVKQIEELIAHLRLTEINIICHSFGGRVALYLMARGKVEINSCALVAPAGIIKRSVKYYVSVFRYKLRKKLKKDVSNFGSRDYLAAPPVMRKTFVNVVNFDLKKYLKKIETPCLIIAGENDEEIPFSSLLTMKRKIKNSNLVTLRGGHFCYINDKDLFFDTVGDFLKNV